MDGPRLEVDLVQLVADGMLRKHRTDGTGWDWCWADWQRDWMDATPSRYAYRCLPLTIANQTGFWVRNPVGFTAVWRGGPRVGDVQFLFDSAADLWKDWIKDNFGEGIITWNTPFLVRTRPVGSGLLVTGPANHFKPYASPLTALIETDWMTMSFTMNWKITLPHTPVRFEVGEPLFQAIPLRSNICADLEGAEVSYLKLEDHPEIEREYREWHDSRRDFQAQVAQGVSREQWQKDYFQGRDMSGRVVAPVHRTKVAHPKVIVRGKPGTPPTAMAPDPGPGSGTETT